MNTRPHVNLRSHALLSTLLVVAAGQLAGCSPAADDAASATQTETAVPAEVASAASSDTNTLEEQIEAADFEGSMQQLMVMVGSDAISILAGSNDLDAILALPPERVIEAVNNGEVEAIMVERSTVEIDGPMARIQTKGQAQYTIIDGEQVAAYVVDPDNTMIMTMDAARMAAARVESGDSIQIDAKQVGERSIRGFDTTGYRFDFIGDNIATVWLSEDLESTVGPIFDIMAAVSPFGPMEVGNGAPVRSVMVNRETLAKGRGFMPAYTITEFYDLQPGAIADGRFDLPEGYQRQSMDDLRRAASAAPGQ